MRKKWLIPMIVVILVLIAGSVIFQQREEDASEDQELDESTIDEDGNGETEESIIGSDDPSDQLDKGTSLDKDGNVVYATDGSDTSVMKDEEESVTPKQGNGGSVGTENVESGQGISASPTTGPNDNGPTGNTSGTKRDPVNAGSSNANAGQQQTSSKKESVTAIKNRYFSEFQQIEFQQNGKIEALAQRAFDQYMNDRESFNANKYKSEAKSLQASSDSAFYGKYGQMQADLAANGHSKQAASDIEQTYQSKKAAKESELKSLVGG